MKTLPIAALCAAVIGSLAIAAPASADDDWRHHMACDYRVCLIVLDEEDDSDGDGIADIDEKYLGTDFTDKLSMPAAQKLVDQALMRELPSFESHLTELVVLPQMTTDFSALATAVGLTDLPTDSWGTTKAPGLFGKLHDNGLTGILSGFGIDLPSSGGQEVPQGSDASHITYMQWVKDGVSASDFSFPYRPAGFNAGRTDGTTTLGPITMMTHEGTTSIDFGTSTYFPDESHKGSSFSGSTSKSTGMATHEVTTSTNNMGETKSQTKVDSTRTTDPKTKVITTTTTVTNTNFDKGRITGSTTTKTKVTADPKTGKKTTETSGTTTDADGQTKPDPPTKPKTEKCEKQDCSDGMADPDYVTFGPLSPDDYRKVMARIGSVRTPGPDTGILTDNPPQIPTRDIYSNYSGDGVVVLSSEPNPHFNIAQPEYNSELGEMAQLGGTVPPNPNADDPTGYWPDKP